MLQLAAVITATHPNIGAFTLSFPGDLILFHSPARVWQRCPVLARRPSAQQGWNEMLISFHPKRLSSDACQTPEILSPKWSLWLNETDQKVRSAKEAGAGSAAKGLYGSDPGQRRYVPTQTVSERESLALLSLRTALRPVEDAIGLSAALWKDQVGSWGQPPTPTLACPATVQIAGNPDETITTAVQPGGRAQAWEAVGCADDGSGRVLKVKLLGLTDGTGSDAGNGNLLIFPGFSVENAMNKWN